MEQLTQFVPTYDVFTVVFLLAAGFIAAFVDSTVGGGGLVTTPSLLALGLPVPYALGSNKLASSMGAVTSFLSFWQAGKMDKKLALCLLPLSFTGAAFGAYVVYLLPEALMKRLIVVLLLVVAVYTFLRKDWGNMPAKTKLGAAAYLAAAVMACALGFYDGFFGPGTGSFLIFGFLFLGFDFVTAAGNAKALNLGSNLGALVSFALAGTIIWQYSLIMGAAMIAGALCGSRMAIKKGASYVRPLFLIVTTILIGRQIYDIFLK